MHNFVYAEQAFTEASGRMERGEIVMAGALGDPPDGALLVFRVSDSTVVERFARNDPYVTNGLITNWKVRPWNVVVGGA